MNESAELFGDARTLVGVVTEPDGPARCGGPPGVILMNAGTNHHVGPGRLMVELARRLASLGCTVLRFDLSGLGDSLEYDGVPYNRLTTGALLARAVKDTRDAMDMLAATRRIDRFLIVGLCSGGRMALHVALHDPRVVGIVTVNGRLREKQLEEQRSRAQEEAAAGFYRSRAIRSPRRWWRLVSGRSNYRMILRGIGSMLRRIARLPANTAAARSTLACSFDALVGRQVRIKVIYGRAEPDLAVFRYLAGQQPMPPDRVELTVLDDVDHVFTSLAMQENLMRLVSDWVLRLAGAAPAGHAVGAGENLEPAAGPRGLEK